MYEQMLGKYIYPVINLSPLSIFSLLALNFVMSEKKYYAAKTVKELFSDTSSDKIITFLKEINLFNKL